MNYTDNNLETFNNTSELINSFNQSMNITNNAASKNLTRVANYYTNVPDSVSVTFVVIPILIFVIGLIGNLIACFVISCSKSMHTTANMYLLNLSIGDVLYLIAIIPSDVYEYVNDDKFYLNSSALCFLKNLIGEFSVNISILSITALTIERYLAICHPFASRAMSQSRIRFSILFIWLFSIMCAAILAWPSEIITDYGQLSCYVKIMPYCIEVMTILFFVSPLAVISILYTLIARRLISRKQIASQTDKQSLRTVKMLVLIVIAFFLCWLPFQLQRLMATYHYLVIGKSRRMFIVIYGCLSLVARVMCVLPTVVNPIIYTFMSSNFRDAFKELLSKSFVTESRTSTIM